MRSWPPARALTPQRTSSRAAQRGTGEVRARRPGSCPPSCGRGRGCPCRGGPPRREGRWRQQPRSCRGVLGVDLAEAAAHAPLPGHELALEPLELLLAAAHQFELGADVLELLVE